MRISIWQQFSSNHSADFTVVGEFESVWHAEKAERELQRILSRIERWWKNLSREEMMEWGRRTETKELTPIEQTLQKELKISWPFSLNWYHWMRDREPVIRYERFLFVVNPNMIWHGPQPFEQLMSKLGGKVDIDVAESMSHPDTLLLMDVQCTLPADKVDAELLYVGLKEDFDAYHRLEWRAFEGEYNANFPLPFYVERMNAETSDGIDPRVFGVERKEDQLFMFGIYGDDFDGSGYVKQIQQMKDFLEGEGCTAFHIAFRTVRNYKWARDISVDDEL